MRLGGDAPTLPTFGSRYTAHLGCVARLEQLLTARRTNPLFLSPLCVIGPSLPVPAQLPEMKPIEIAVGHHTPYDDFVAPGKVDDVNRSTWRPRGAGVGNIWQEPGEPDM